MRRATIGVLLLAVVAAAAWFLTHRQPPPPSFVTAAVTRGPIVKVVASTGTLQAVTSVDVGAELSGVIATLGADFNSIVTKGQVLATLDPSLCQNRGRTGAGQPGSGEGGGRSRAGGRRGRRPDARSGSVARVA